MMRRLSLVVALVAVAAPAFAQGAPPIPYGIDPRSLTQPIVFPASAVNGAGIVTSPQVLLQNGAATAPAISFAAELTLGWLRAGAGNIALATSSNHLTADIADDAVFFTSTTRFGWTNSTTNAFAGSVDTQLTRPAAGNILLTATSAPLQLRATQTTQPTCSANCGTSPAVAGTDTAGIVTMGATGVPASGWVITFNGTWAAAPSCGVWSALSSMVVGKMPIAMQTSTTTLTVTTNGTAPANSDKYAYICVGVQ